MTVAFFVCALCYVLLFPFGPGKIPKIEWAPLTNVTITVSFEGDLPISVVTCLKTSHYHLSQ